MASIQTSFRGGMNKIDEETRVQNGQYIDLINGRNRFDTLQPIKNPSLLNTPVGKKQGLYGAGTFLLLFVLGDAYYNRPQENNTWTKLTLDDGSGLGLDPTADHIYICPVPASTFNYKRLLAPTSDPKDPPILQIVNVTGTPAALVVQDGVSQPVLIFPDGTCRITKTWNEWNNDPGGEREYVPVGKQMLFEDGILYVVDGPRILRSVSGRPIDFMVQVDLNGNKGTSELLAGARSVSHQPSYEDITCIASLGVEDNLYVGTANNSYLLIVDRTNLIFGEPVLRSRPLFPFGCVNQFCFIDITGDYVFTDHRGLRSFNSVKQLRTDGNNSVFSLNVAPLFKDIFQDATLCASIVYDNFALFSVKTVYGFVNIIYDILNQTFVGWDQTVASPTRQFARLEPYTTKLYALVGEEVYALFQSSDANPYATCTAKLRVECSDDPKVEVLPKAFRAVFAYNIVAGTVTVTPYVNGKKFSSQRQALKATFSGIPFPVTYPVSFQGAGSVNNKLFPLPPTGAPQGWKVGIVLQWNNGATLTHASLELAPTTMQKSMQEQSTP